MDMDFYGIFDKAEELVGGIDFGAFIEALRSLSPSDFFTNLWLGVPLLVIILLLVAFKALRGLSLVLGTFALWSANVYFMPGSGEELELTKLVSFAIVCLFVGVLWIYMFFIRGD
ncbi:MAG TPA: hypothetical protein ENJ63_00895 [Dissulfuribacter thermophilus]|uniref:Uncharacterized protein n=1 Tax=Dissulfuribacter thermophilus TaxID=1156395 RepID=A0A7V2WSD4_9BACT|nr:hypothetical protein [Dissulfuribacter thermophilus]